MSSLEKTSPESGNVSATRNWQTWPGHRFVCAGSRVYCSIRRESQRVRSSNKKTWSAQASACELSRQTLVRDAVRRPSEARPEHRVLRKPGTHESRSAKTHHQEHDEEEARVGVLVRRHQQTKRPSCHLKSTHKPNTTTSARKRRPREWTPTSFRESCQWRQVRREYTVRTVGWQGSARERTNTGNEPTPVIPPRQ